MRLRSRGFTLLEVAVGAALVALVLVGSLESVESAGRMTLLQTQRRVALEAAETKLAYLRALHFSNVVTTVAACTTLSSFTVAGLPARRKAGATQGTLAIYTDETHVPAEVGGPMDLNGNGNATDTSVVADAKILPVSVTIRWGTVGNGNAESSITLWTILNSSDAP